MGEKRGPGEGNRSVGRSRDGGARSGRRDGRAHWGLRVDHSGSPRRVRFGALRLDRWLDYLKLGAVAAVAAVYSYVLFLQPLSGTNPPVWPVLGSPLTRLVSVGLQQRQAEAAADDCGVPLGVMWPVYAPGGGSESGLWPVLTSSDGAEGSPSAWAAIPVSTDLLYGAVAEADLPWYAEPPARLTELRLQVGADRLVAAFRTTLPNPIWDELENVGQGAQYLAGTVVQPGQDLSLFAVIGPFTKARGYGDGPSYAGNRVVPSTGGGVCKIATTLYNVAVHSDMQVLERRPHSMLVPYVPPGRDAAIATGAKDVRFRNAKDTPVLLWAGMREKTLFIAVYGQYDPPLVEWFHEESNRNSAKPVRHPNSDLPSGVEQLVIEGYDGVTVHTWLVIKRPGQPDERRDLGSDTYRPLPGVIEYGP